MLTLDRAVGDRWLVTKGLAAGDRVIVDGLQRIRPGADVKAVPFAVPRRRGRAGRRAGRRARRERAGGEVRGRAMSAFFLKRPVFAWVIAIAMMLAGVLAIVKLPVSQYPPDRPALDRDPGHLPRRVGEDRRGLRRPDHRAEDDRPRPDALHGLHVRLVGERRRSRSPSRRGPTPTSPGRRSRTSSSSRCPPSPTSSSRPASRSASRPGTTSSSPASSPRTAAWTAPTSTTTSSRRSSRSSAASPGSARSRSSARPTRCGSGSTRTS